MEDFLKQIVREAGDAAIPFFIGGVESTNKGTRVDLLTEADLITSTFLVNAIHDKFPTHHIHSEELSEDINPGAEFEWVIDPIDGTWNFKNRIPLWAVMVTVLQNSEPEYAAVYYPMLNEFYFAKRGAGAFMNKKMLRMSSFGEVSGAAGDVYVEPNAPLVERYRRAWQGINQQLGHATNYGSMYGAAQTVQGLFDFYINNAGRDHDYLPFVLFAKEGGAVVTDIDGNDWQRHRRDIIIANPVLHPLLLQFFIE